MSYGKFVVPLEDDDKAIYTFRGNPQGYKGAHIRKLLVCKRNYDTILEEICQMNYQCGLRGESFFKRIYVYYPSGESLEFADGQYITIVYDSQYNPIGVMV